MIAFAAKAGSTASDGNATNSPFAAALVQHLPTPGLDVRKAFGFVRDDVLKNTGYKQEPYVYGSLGGDDVPLVTAKPVIAGPQPNPEDVVRRDYEFALQLGTRDGWNAFLTRYPSGFYSDLARGQLNKIVAEETRASTVDKTRLAEQEKARLAAEGAKRAEQEKPAAEAGAAEEATVAAEQAKARPKAEVVEQARIEAEKAGQMDAQKAAATSHAQKEQKVAAVSTAAEDSHQQTAGDLPRALQSELRRVGCHTGVVDGNWNESSKQALDKFNKHSGNSFDIRIASLDALDAVKAKTSRVCPLVCEYGFKADGDHCVKITCRSGYRLNRDNNCEKTRADGRKPSEQPSQSRPESVVPKTGEAKETTQGESGCNRAHDKIGCLCAVRNGGGVNTNGHWYSKRGSNTPANEAFVQCQLRAGRR
jgi:hypothetical protein